MSDKDETEEVKDAEAAAEEEESGEEEASEESSAEEGEAEVADSEDESEPEEEASAEDEDAEEDSDDVEESESEEEASAEDADEESDKESDDVEESEPEEEASAEDEDADEDSDDDEESEPEEEASAEDEDADEDSDDDEESEPEEEASAEDEEADEDSDDDEESAPEEEASADDEEAAKDEAREETYQESVDRRQSGRKGVKLSRLISSKIIDGDSERECYLHLVDISDGGLRINSDDPFPEDRQFTLEIGLAPFGNELATKTPIQAFPVKVVWTKSLVGGMVVSGLAFQNLDEAGQEVVEAIMQGASPQGRRMHFRLNRVLGVELGRDEEDQQWLYPLTLDLSVEGMRICLSDPLEVGAKFPIKVFLEFELPTVKANAEVMWQETMPSGRVQVGLKFEDMSERDAMAIKTYIDQCLNQDEAHRRL